MPRRWPLLSTPLFRCALPAPRRQCELDNATLHRDLSAALEKILNHKLALQVRGVDFVPSPMGEGGGRYVSKQYSCCICLCGVGVLGADDAARAWTL